MKFCLDTNLILWTMFQPEKLSPKASEILRDRQHSLYFSVVSIWETAIKTALSRSDFDVDARNLRRYLFNEGYGELSIQSEHAFLAATLPPLHKDPFDRMLIAQATVEGITLLTADAKIAKYPGPIERV